jgi:hypothetical protein
MNLRLLVGVLQRFVFLDSLLTYLVRVRASERSNRIFPESWPHQRPNSDTAFHTVVPGYNLECQCKRWYIGSNKVSSCDTSEYHMNVSTVTLPSSTLLEQEIVEEVDETCCAT